MNKSTKIITAFAAGAAAGAILGILFAPGKGSDTRKKIKDQAKKLKDDLDERWCSAEQKLKDLKEEMEETLKDKSEKFT